MSVALLEALASGLPVIVTETGGTAELVDGNGLIVPWAEPAVLADAMETLLIEPTKHHSMGQQSLQIAERYAWESTACAYLELGRTCIGKGV
jgi:glycosyltransferase involved in cell wall biosynthesis